MFTTTNPILAELCNSEPHSTHVAIQLTSWLTEKAWEGVVAEIVRLGLRDAFQLRFAELKIVSPNGSQLLFRTVSKDDALKGRMDNFRGLVVSKVHVIDHPASDRILEYFRHYVRSR